MTKHEYSMRLGALTERYIASRRPNRRRPVLVSEVIEALQTEIDSLRFIDEYVRAHAGTSTNSPASAMA
jgi:hypothetical protein